MSRAGAFLAGGLVATVGMCALAAPVVMSAGALFGGDLKEGVVPVSCGSETTIRQVARNTPKVAGFSTEQIRNATAIVTAGQDMKVPPRGWVIAVATALQESTLHNYGDLGARNDHDSQGLFQQRPSQGWGTVEQIRDPAYASKSFYSRLIKIKGWQSLPLTKAAQRVQRSAYPNAYAKWEDDASKIVDDITGGASKTPSSALTVGACAQADQVTSSGWVRPVSAPIGSPFGQRSGRLHAGVDLSTSKGKPVVAAASGTVIHMECDKAEIGYNCDRDGSPSTPGCGWYLDIRHAGGWITRYCHMLRKPLVGTGDKVRAGQQIGVVGTSGHSSGPHLHFETHDGSRDSSSAIDPVKFMKEHGAPLGEGKQQPEVKT